MTAAAQLDQRDIAALIGLLAGLEGAVLAGDLPLDQGLRLRRRLVDAGLLTADQPYTDFAEALAALNQRLRTWEDPGTAMDHGDVVENVLAFPEEAGAEAFVEQLRGHGRDVDDPVHEEAVRRWTVVVRLHLPAGERFAPVGPDVAVARALGGWHLGAS